MITELSLHVRPRPASTHYEAMFFETFEQGAEALRLVAQERRAPDIARLSDEEETRLTMAMAGGGGLKGRIGRGYIRARGYAGGCSRRSSAGRATPRRVRQRSAIDHAPAPGRRPPARRLAGPGLGGRPVRAPVLRDDMLALGVMVDTVETAGRWSGPARPP